MSGAMGQADARRTRRVHGRHIEAEALATDPALDLVASRVHPWPPLVAGLALLAVGIGGLVCLGVYWEDLVVVAGRPVGRDHPLNMAIGLSVLAILVALLLLAIWTIGRARLHDRDTGVQLRLLHTGDWPMRRDGAWGFRQRLATLDPRLLEPPPNRAVGKWRAIRDATHQAARIAVYDDPAARRAYVGVVHTLALGSPAQAYPSIVYEGDAYDDLTAFAARGFRLGALAPADRDRLERRYGRLQLE